MLETLSAEDLMKVPLEVVDQTLFGVVEAPIRGGAEMLFVDMFVTVTTKESPRVPTIRRLRLNLEQAADMVSRLQTCLAEAMRQEQAKGPTERR